MNINSIDRVGRNVLEIIKEIIKENIKLSKFENTKGVIIHLQKIEMLQR